MSAPDPALILSAPDDPVSASAALLPVTAKPSLWPDRSMVTPADAAAAEIASTATICASVAVFRSPEDPLRIIVSTPLPPVTVSAPTKS